MSKIRLTVALGVLFISCHALSWAAEKELTIPKENYYREVSFSKKCRPAGARLKPLAPDWQSFSLDGTWKFKEVPFKKDNANPLDDEGMTKKYFAAAMNSADWQNTIVPYSWYKGQPDKPKRDFVMGKIGWYRRGITITPEQLANGKRIVLDFRRVAWQTDVWVNGKKAGKRHVGRFDSFQYDVTSLVKEGENSLAVRVYDYVGHTNYERRHIGGIYHPVRLLVLPTTVQSQRMMVTSLLPESAIEVETELLNPTAAPITLTLKAEVADWKTGAVIASDTLPPIKIEPGRKWFRLGKIKLANPIPWTGENPQLYTLRLIDDQGHSVGMERFGFRDFRAQGEWLLLNGKKFKPRAFTLDLWRNQDFLDNKNALLEKLLRYYKSRGINMIRPHSMNGMLCESFFTLCDELGILVYLDWSGPNYYLTYDKKWKDSVLEMWPSFKQFIRDNYSHPSICMWSFGNEIYENYQGTIFSKNLDKLYGLVKTLDRQGRPICTSTGRQTIGAMRDRRNKERTDILDDHQYRGAYCGSWQENIGHINAYAKMALECYGKLMPKIDGEYGVPGDTLRYRNITFKKLYPAFLLAPKSEKFKRQYIKFITSERREVGGYIRLKIAYCAVRDYILNEAQCRRLYAEKLAKRTIEVYRRAGVKCLGGHTNAQWYDLILPPKNWSNTSATWNKPGPIDITKDQWIELPLSFVMKRVYNPTLVSLPPFNQHPQPGSKQKITVVVTNDLNESGLFKVIAQLRFAGEKALKIGELDFGKIGGMQQKNLPLSYVAPTLTETKRGRLELFLFKNGKRVGDNYYPLTSAVTTSIASTSRIALYDSAERVFRGLVKQTTSRLLGKLGVKTEPLADFQELAKFKYLIIGANSFDKTVIDAGKQIYDWVKKGGKVLCFEQRLCGRIPFYPTLSVVAGARSNFTPLAVPTHPLFAGLEQEDFDTWQGSDLGALYDYALGPLNVGLVAIAATGSWLDAKEDAKPVICDIKSGAGQIILSQLAVTKCAPTDSVAKAYAVNLVRYFLREGVSEFALPLREKKFRKNIFIENKNAFFVDLSGVVNRDFSAKQQSGWAGFGTGFREIPLGKTRLQGGVPFFIINPAKNKGKSCLVLKGKKRASFPEKVTGIPINAKLNKIYFLHTSMYAVKGTVLRYVFHFANGETREFVADLKHDLPDWWNPSDKDNAFVVFRKGKKGLFLSEFVNPLPKETIKTMDIISAGGSIPIVIAVTGRKRFTSVIAGRGEY